MKTDIKITINKIHNDDYSSLRATASANINNEFAVHDIKIFETDNGLSVTMPSTVTMAGGKKEYHNIFHPIDNTARTEFIDKILKAYDDKRNEL